MGGVIAFEMARQLQQQGQEVAMLALMDATVPEADESEYNWAILLSIFAFDLGLTEENFKRPSAWTPVPQMAQLRQLWVEARRAGVVPSEMTLVEFRKLFDVFKIHANTLRRYKAGEFQGRITLFSPAEDVEQIIFNRNSADAAMERENPREVDPLKGWGKLATDGVDLHQVPGNHFTMLREPNVQALGEQLRECIEQTQARRNGGTQ
jgi:thioesterase domain-containing protein